MSDWSLGAVNARKMKIVALCEEESCRHIFAFNLDALIEGVGPRLQSRGHSPLDARPPGHDIKSTAPWSCRRGRKA
jgi:hypothetical protein